VLRLLNACEGLGLPSLEDKTLDTVKDRIEATQSSAIRQELMSLIELYQLRHEVERGNTVNLASLLESWSDRRHLWLFPAVLDLLITHGFDDASIRAQADDLLRRSPDDDQYNSFFFLALTLAER
jgi:hypothetical protein